MYVKNFEWVIYSQWVSHDPCLLFYSVWYTLSFISWLWVNFYVYRSVCRSIRRQANVPCVRSGYWVVNRAWSGSSIRLSCCECYLNITRMHSFTYCWYSFRRRHYHGRWFLCMANDKTCPAQSITTCYKYVIRGTHKIKILRNFLISASASLSQITTRHVTTCSHELLLSFWNVMFMAKKFLTLWVRHLRYRPAMTKM